MTKPFCCPVPKITKYGCLVCGSTGIVWEPSALAPAWWPSIAVQCPACDGTGTVWAYPAPAPPVVVLDPQHDGCDPNEPCSTGCPAGARR